MRFSVTHNEQIKSVALENAPKNLKLTAPDIQQDISNVVALEIVSAIIKDLNEDLFDALIDEACDTRSKNNCFAICG